MQELKIPVAEIIGRPGTYRDIEVAAPLEGLRNALAGVTQSPISVSGRAESVVEGILVTGRAATMAAMECARCLAPLTASLNVELCELYVLDPADTEDDAYAIEGRPPEIDLEPMLRDSVTLALPLNPLCREDCKGLCARCGRDLNTGDCDCTEDEMDPRWAELSALREKLNQ